MVPFGLIGMPRLEPYFLELPAQVEVPIGNYGGPHNGEKQKFGHNYITIWQL
jgi:hypothetical protein